MMNKYSWQAIATFISLLFTHTAQAESVAVADVVREIPQPSEGKVSPDSREQIILSFAPVVKQVSPAVVNIYARQINASKPLKETPFDFDPFYKQFHKKQDPHFNPERSLGSGVIVSEDGIIVTNYHVIKPVDEIRVVLHDKREFYGKLLVVDHQTDLAAIQIHLEGEKLPFLALEDDEDIEVGDLVLAIGNPFGVGQSVTSGIISALSRAQKGISTLRSFIQTDAAINPGNSGGALVTTDGRLIGINTAIYSKTGGSVGIGFAVPSILAKTLLESARSGLPIQRPWIGIKLHPVTMKTANTLGLSTPNGALVKDIYPESPGDKAGLKVGDLITEINGEVIEDEADFEFEIAILPLGAEAQITLQRGGKKITLPVALQPPLVHKGVKPLMMRGANPLQGAFMKTLAPGLALSLGLDPHLRGVVIVDLPEDSQARKLRFQEGDVVTTVNGAAVDEVNDLQRLIGKRHKEWKIELRRGDKIITVQVYEKKPTAK